MKTLLVVGALALCCSPLVACKSSASANAASGSGGATSGSGASGGSSPAGTGGSGTSSTATTGTGGTMGAGGTGSGDAGAGGSGTGGAGGIVGPTGLVHPGILVDKGMLDFVKAQIAAGAQPWKGALAQASSDSLGSLTYTPAPRANVDCGPSSNPDLGCTDEKNDVAAAYTDALIWYHTGNQKYADMAIKIMNAWSSTLQEHTGSNAPLQSAWAAEVFPRAAEIIRYSNAGWSSSDVQQFSTMLEKVYLPEVVNGSTSNGNWDTSMIEATMNIAVFLDDMTTFKKAVAMWRARTPAYIYLTSDGALPVQPPNDPKSTSALTTYWYSPAKFIDGLTQESCRDLPNSGTQGFGHAQYGVAGIINAAETARIQGTDLFSSEQKRIVAMLELHSKYLNGASITSLCDTLIAPVGPDPMWEIGYNAYANVLGQSLPETLQLVKSIRPTGATHHMVWETLTHGAIGSAGL
jgi:Alginate lyase